MDQLKPDHVGAFRASGKFLTLTDCDRVGETVLGVEHTINPAVGNQVAGVVSLLAHLEISQSRAPILPDERGQDMAIMIANKFVIIA